jgi:hypothetical protein
MIPFLYLNCHGLQVVCVVGLKYGIMVDL